MNASYHSQQRPVMTRGELKASIDEILAAGIDEDEQGGPDVSQLRKASRQLDAIMGQVDKYISRHA